MSDSRYQERLTVLEAALYAAGRPVDIEGLKLVVQTKSEKIIRKLVSELSIRYQTRKSALEVQMLPGNRAVMRLKEEFDSSVKKFTDRPLLSTGPLRTLSYVAYHQPVEQMKVVEDRGSHVYSHLRLMEEMGLITRKRMDNRGFMIETTRYFSEYFGFGYDPLKSKIQLRQMFNSLKIHKMDNGEEKSDSSELLSDVFSETPLGDPFDAF
ncbi:putative transcriptional regulator [Thaumarchaeota archaeon SCGC AB-539-E09]|nr:putative transcriptional regulator [Thaumarchaeota archaeon SCGC AB-539-E09]